MAQATRKETVADLLDWHGGAYQPRTVNFSTAITKFAEEAAEYHVGAGREATSTLVASFAGVIRGMLAVNAIEVKVDDLTAEYYFQKS